MQEEPFTVITRMNRAYNAVYGTLCPETRRRAEETFSRCQNWLSQRGIPFRQSLAGTWILDSTTSQTLAQSSQSQQQKVSDE